MQNYLPKVTLDVFMPHVTQTFKNQNRNVIIFMSINNGLARTSPPAATDGFTIYGHRGFWAVIG